MTASLAAIQFDGHLPCYIVTTNAIPHTSSSLCWDDAILILNPPTIMWTSNL